MGAYSEQTYASAARGTRDDEDRWQAARNRSKQGWEGETLSTTQVMEDTTDTGCFVTWNAGKRFATSEKAQGRATRAETANWELALDTMLSLEHDIMAMQETGAGGSREDEIRVRGIIDNWSRKRGVLARTWLAGSCGFNEDGKDLRYLGGTAGGLALVAIGSWAARGRAARRFPNGRGLWVEFQEGSRLLCFFSIISFTSKASPSGNAPCRSTGHSSSPVGLDTMAKNRFYLVRLVRRGIRSAFMRLCRVRVRRSL